MSISKLIEPGDAVSASDVNQNFYSFSTDLADVVSGDIEDSSIRTRHIAVSQGAWKEVTVHTNAGPWTQAAGTVRICPSGATDTVTRTGQMVLVVATVQLHSTGAAGAATCSAEFQLKLDGVTRRTMTVKTLGSEKLQVATTFAFQATDDVHEIYLWVITGGASFSASNAELQVIAVRG
jgi:hypothetical protein